MPASNPPHILVVVNLLHEPGGYSTVCAWALQGLVETTRVTVVCEGPIDWQAVDKLFGTSLTPHQLPVVTPMSGLFNLLRRMPVRLSLLRLMLLNRALRAHLQTPNDFDQILSFLNEFSPGRAAVQYVHYPLGIYPRPDADLRWYHPAWLLKPYRWLALRFGGLNRTGITANKTLANSAWTAAEFERWYQHKAQILYPPVSQAKVPAPSANGQRFLCLGRLAPEKELQKVVSIIAQVRQQHPDASLTIAGAAADAATTAQLRQLAEQHRWLSVHTDLDRAHFEALIGDSDFGIHGMIAEHFGITVAEMLRAGRPIFVPDDAGPAEIVDQHPGLTYANVDHAAQQINHALSQDEQRKMLYRFAAERGEYFSETSFMQQLNRAVLR